MLSRRTKYGIKALIYISQEERKDRLVSIKDISESEKISQKFLESIMLTLKKAGFLSSRKGKGGGYHLRRKSSDIMMVEVMRSLEGPVALLPCVSLNFYEKCADCKDEDACSIHRLMMQIRDNTLKILENTTLADLVIMPEPSKN